MKNTLMTAGLIGAAALAWAAKDPVLMTVNGLDVPKSEFEYLYHKNAQQQIESQGLPEYVEMFKVYKLKVADALDQGIDTTAAFRKEMDQYKKDLAAPYMADSLYLEELVRKTYDRSRQEAEAIHIMIPRQPRPGVASPRQLADSLQALLAAGADFAELAAAYSTDNASKNNGGNMGFITVNRLPYNFEAAVFDTPEGEVTGVVESPVGYHILKGGRKRPARGQMLTAHIMKMVAPNASPEEEASAKAWIDSVYNVLQATPGHFSKIALEQSEDKGSARQGGQLPWFGAGMMVAPFDSAAFALKENDDISAPVRSQYGWHIIKRLGHKDSESMEELKPMLLAKFNSPQDDRFHLIRKHTVESLARKHKAKTNETNYNRLKNLLSQGMDSTFMERVNSAEFASLPVYQVGKKQYTVPEMMSEFKLSQTADPLRAAEMLQSYFDYFQYRTLLEAEEDWLYANESDYRNLLNEYRDGSLLYEASVQKVWDKASKDTEGLQKFFEANRANYSWTAPHAKGLLVQAANDSVADAVRSWLDAHGTDPEVLRNLRKEFNKQANVERVLVERGQNAMVDNLMFDGPKVTPSNAAYTVYFMYNPVILNAPEEVADVRGLVTSDYQNQLEQDWVEALKAKYPVTIYEKVLKKVK